MDTLKDWLAPTILPALQKAIQWRMQQVAGAAPSRSRGSGGFISQESNLTVRMPDQGYVQMIKFREHDLEPPYKVTISDGFTRINTVIAVSASEKLEKQKKRRFTTDTKGGFLFIRAFEIVGTPYGTREDRITLRILDFNWVAAGSARSYLPRAIESVDKDSAHPLLDQLDELWRLEGASKKQNQNSRTGGTAVDSTTSPGNTCSADDSEMPCATQVDFATQAPLTKPSTTGPIPSDRTDNGSKIPKGDLLSAFEGGGGVRSLESNNTTQDRQKSRQNPMELLEGMSKLQTVHPESSSSARAMLSGGDVRSAKELPSMDSGEPSVSLQHIVGARKGLDDVYIGSERPTKRRKQKELIDPNEVYISSDQEELLKRPDSWIPPHPSERAPSANVPIGILESLNLEADLRYTNSIRTRQIHSAKTGRETLQVFSPSRSLGKDSNQSDIDSAESLLDSEEWPDSPERNQLPPDSSLPSAAHSDHEDLPTGKDLPEKSLGPARDQTVAASVTKLDQASDQKNKEEMGTSRSTPYLLAETKAEVDQDAVLSQTDVNDRATLPLHSSQEESDIEIVVPIALKETSQSRMNISSQSVTNSSASLPESIFTQVKTTPYVNGIRQQSLLPKTDGDALQALNKTKDAETSIASIRAIRSLAPSSPVAGNRPQAMHTDAIEIDTSSAEEDERSKFSTTQKRSAPQTLADPQSKKLRRLPDLPTLVTPSQEELLLDPAVSARQYRQEWFAAHQTDDKCTHGQSPISQTAESPQVVQQASRASFSEEESIPTSMKDLQPEMQTLGDIGSPILGSPEEAGLHNEENGYDAETEDSSSGNRHSCQIAEATEIEETASNRPGSSPSTKTAPTVNNPEEQTLLVNKGQSLQNPGKVPGSLTARLSPGNSLLTNIQDVYRQFCATYPSYNGDQQHFLALCRKLEKMAISFRHLHRSLWDDFVLRHDRDYSQHLLQCQKTVEDPLTYEAFFNDMVDSPTCSHNVLNSDSMKIMLGGEMPRYPGSRSNSGLSTPGPPAQLSPSRSNLRDASVHPPIVPEKAKTRVDLRADSQTPVDTTKVQQVNQRSLGANEENSDTRDNVDQPDLKPGDVEAEDSSKSRRTNTAIDLTTSRSNRINDGEASRLQDQPPPNSSSLVTGRGDIRTSAETIISKMKDTVGPSQAAKKQRAVPRPSLPHAQARAPTEWWQDENTPFKAFAKNYAAIRPGNGNSYAQEKKEKGDAKEQEAVRRSLGDLSVLSWRL